MAWFRIVLWLRQGESVRVVRGIRFYDKSLQEVHLYMYEKTEEAFPTSNIYRIEVQVLDKNSQTVFEYLQFMEKKRLLARKKIIKTFS
jgi:hypothetical protein